jgi:hypothetical protein
MLDAGGSDEVEGVLERLRSRGRPPARLVEESGRAARIVLLSDVHGRTGPKRLAAESIRRLADGPGLDAVVLEVPSSEQPYIDAYLAAASEDATVLLARPAAVQAPAGAPREYLELYRAVRQVNEAVGAARRIRVIAADLEGWPPPEGVSSQEVAERYARRAEHMLTRMDEELLSVMPEARVLVFVDGYLTLRGGYGHLELAGGSTRRVEWLGEMLRRRSGPDARTVLVDVAGRGTMAERLPRYHGTRLHRPLSRELSGAAGIPATEAFGAVGDPILELSSPGLRLEIRPEGYTLDDVADGYVYLEGGR